MHHANTHSHHNPERGDIFNIWHTTNMVPALGYFTLLDLFIGVSTILVFLALLESLAVTYLVSKDRKGLARSIDLKSRFFYPLAFLLLIIVLFII